MDNDEYNADVKPLSDNEDLGPEQSAVPPHDADAEQDNQAPAEPVEVAPGIPESPVGAEEDTENDPEKPEFGEYEDSSTDLTEEHADFDAGNDDEAASEQPR